jgi:hypothetical protein
VGGAWKEYISVAFGQLLPVSHIAAAHIFSQLVIESAAPACLESSSEAFDIPKMDEELAPECNLSSGSGHHFPSYRASRESALRISFQDKALDELVTREHTPWVDHRGKALTWSRPNHVGEHTALAHLSNQDSDANPSTPVQLMVSAHIPWADLRVTATVSLRPTRVGASTDPAHPFDRESGMTRWEL